MKNTIMSLLLVVVCIFVVTSPCFAEDTFEEYYRMDKVLAYHQNGTIKLNVQNYSQTGGEFKVLIYDNKTKALLYTLTDFIEGKTTTSPVNKNYSWQVGSSAPKPLVVDYIVFRSNTSVQPIFTIY